MLGSVSLEVAIGLVMTFSLFSVMMQSVREGIESMLKQRAKMLEQTITGILKTDTAVKKFYESAVIDPLFRGAYKTGSRALPSYIPSANFAVAVAGLVRDGVTLPDALQPLVERIGDPLASSAAAVAELEALYDSAMDRLSGSYKRATQAWLFWLGLVIAGVCNINPILIGDRLAVDQELRTNIAAIAPAAQTNALAGEGGSPATTAVVTQIQEQMEINGLPVGWKAGTVQTLFGDSDHPTLAAGILESLAGWVIAALAAMLGAPFWFDILNKLVNLRGALKPTSPPDDPPKAVTMASVEPVDTDMAKAATAQDDTDAC